MGLGDRAKPLGYRAGVLLVQMIPSDIEPVFYSVEQPIQIHIQEILSTTQYRYFDKSKQPIPQENRL